MSRLRIIIAALMLLAWAPAVNSCAIAAAFPDKLQDCCDVDNGGDTGGGIPACDGCSTLYNGFQPGQPLVLNAPIRVEVDAAWLADLLREISVAVSEEVPVASCEIPPPLHSLWQFVVRTALPVRGPSFA